MPFRNAQTLQRWVDEFHELGYPSAGTHSVITQDGAAGADTGLIAVHLGDADTSIYIQPESHDSDRWVVTLEPRDEPITLDPAALFRLASELSAVSVLCAFLQSKSQSSSADLTG
jgi:hypothetical protein